ncbi:MAG TPA: hypothetical protein VHX36_03685 [Candidatus Acidoferrales bacterium]|jgi:hypothetical protein|nr:hypothetical protein [Candidatus Acidoferrales bacterium]
MRAKFALTATLCCLALGIGAAIVAPGVAHATGPIPADCDRACLENLATQYLNALVAHDPKQLPLAQDVRYTEQDQVMDVGDGFWGTATAVGHFRLCFSDLVMEQIGCMVTMHEGDHLLIMSLRLRVELGRITEIETMYYRQGGGGPNGIPALDASTPDPIWSATVPSADRPPRAQMIATANMYFAGLENNDGKGVYPFADDCNRTENGAQTTNNPRPAPNGGFDAFGLSCMAQFKSGYYAVVTRIHHRRFPIVDQERGVVWANVIFDQNGTVHTIHLTNGQTVTMPGLFNRPSSIEVTEAFKITGGLIHRIEMVGSGLQYHLNSAWGGISDK